jgi:DNA modification methylase
MCGDSTNEENVKALLHGAEPHLMVTDPPYGVEYDANWRNEALKSNGKPLGDRAIGKVANDNRADWTEAWRLFKGDVCYVWHASIFSDVVAISLKNCDFEMKALIIWNKSNFAIGRSHYHHKHEPCWYAIKKGMTGHWQGSRKETTVWDIAKPQKSETGHSTQKPIECMEKPIINNSQIDNHVYEPFCGSGTTLIACEKTNRKCLAMELEPKYCDVIITRWENFTGEKAIHAESNKTFEQLKKEKNNE